MAQYQSRLRVYTREMNGKLIISLRGLDPKGELLYARLDSFWKYFAFSRGVVKADLSKLREKARATGNPLRLSNARRAPVYHCISTHPRTVRIKPEIYRAEVSE